VELRAGGQRGGDGADKKVLDEATARVGAVVGGRNTYEAPQAWGGHNRVAV